MIVAAVVAVAVAAGLVCWGWRRPPHDRTARRRLLRELRRHNAQLYERSESSNP